MNDNMKVPEGWKRVRLGEKEFFKIVGSGIEYFQGYKNYLSTNSVQYSQITHIEEIISYRNRPSRANMQPKKDRIAFAKMRNSIKVLLINEELEKEYILSTGFAMIETTINPKYVYQYFLSDRFNYQKDLLAEGTTQEAISNDDFDKIFITFPIFYSEQQKIAEILETVDRAIEKTDKIIEKYKRIKQGLMQDLLTKGIDENGKIRSEKTHKFKNSPLGRIPEEWEVVRLGEVFRLKSGETRPYNMTDIGIYPVYGGNGIIGYSTEKNFEGKTIIIGRVGEYCGCVYIANIGWVTDNALYVVNKKINYYDQFLYYLLTYFNLNQHSSETGQPLMTQSIINMIIIPLPPLPEQQRIAEILSQIDNTIEKEQAYKQKLERIKKGLMEDLLTGKVRVNKLIKEEEKNEK